MAAADGAALTPGEQIEQAESYKQQGNTFFKEGSYRRALGNYHKVFCFVNGLQIPGEKNEASSYADMMGTSMTSASQVPKERVEDVKKLKQSTHLNMAACYLKLSEHQKCVTACNKALAQGQLSKAHFRRGQAQLELRNLDEAKQDFEKARELEPSDPAIEKELKRLKVAFAQQDAKARKTFARMFKKDSEAAADAKAAEGSAEAEATPTAPATAAPAEPAEAGAG
mmetsp:Transcript_59037/g.175629  ORF Transcript_59037/g.175629 Transcript_59037/m.175629 type:complete len:226 (+) Transcript_59037:71-748(+)